MKEETIWNNVSFIISSRYRKKVLSSLQIPKTPSQLSKELQINKTHISRTLSELGKRKLVKCLTPESKKGRIYLIMEKGKKSLKKISKM